MKTCFRRLLPLLLCLTCLSCLLPACSAPPSSGAVDETDRTASPADAVDTLPHYDLSGEEAYHWEQEGPFEPVCLAGGEWFRTNSTRITVSNQSDFAVTVYLYIGTAGEEAPDEPDLQMPLAAGETGAFQNLTSRQRYALGAAVPEGAEGTLDITVSD